jgi:cytochrome P450
MEVKPVRVPPGPQEDPQTPDDLLSWIGDRFKVFGDTYKASLYGTNVYVTRDLAFAHHVLVENWQNYVKGQFIKRVALLLGNGLMVSEGELWKRQRRMIQLAFHHDSVSGLTRLIATVNSELLTKWRLAAQRNETINVTRDVSHMALEVVLRSILSDDYEQIAVHFNFLSDESARDLAFAHTFRRLGKLILQVAERRRKEHVEFTDILGVVLRARDPHSGQPMQNGQLINEILTLIVAGHETTASTLGWTWYLISQHPDVDERLSSELNNLTKLPEMDDLRRFPYSQQIVEESMRLYPSGWLMTRKALRDDRLGDYFVPAGTEIYISPYFIQRHPTVWDDPDRFNPDRFGLPNAKELHRLAMIPFSAGPRNCIGASFARMEMQIHLMTIAKELRLRYFQSRPIELDAGVNLRSKYDFIMNPEIKQRQLAASR